MPAHNHDVDVLVVGGGPAGLVCAATTASNGLSTLLLEQEDRIGAPVRTSGATTLKTMQDFHVPSELYHPVRSVRISSPGRTAVFDYPAPIACIIDVCGVYRHLADAAVGEGARILTGAQATRPVMNEGFVTGCEAVRGKEPMRISAKIVVDAGGYRATISKQAGLHPGFKRFGVGSEYDLYAPDCRQDEMVIILGAACAPSGYAWVFPWGNGRVRVGVGILHSDSVVNPRDRLDVVVERARASGVNLGDFRIMEEHSGLIPSDGIAANLVGDGIMAAGDAGGQASLVAGEGIRLSMRAGRMAGLTACRAIADGTWDKRSLMPYERSFRSAYGRNLGIGHALNRRMSLWDDRMWDEQVDTIRSIPPKLLAGLLLSEFSPPRLFLCAAFRPRLWGRALRYGFKALPGLFRSSGPARLL